MFWVQFPRPDGLPDVDTPRSQMVRHLGDMSVLALDAKEKDALFLSLALTLGRAHYHEHRFKHVIMALDKRHRETGGMGAFDLFAQYTIYEASAALGAVRLGIDELIFITARLRNVSVEAIDANWKANTVLNAGLDRHPEFDIEEILALRARKGWHDDLNAYRNVLHHRGWRSHIGAYYPIGSSRSEARDPEQNVMLAPDRASLADRTRPHDWTYTGCVRLEDVVERAMRGFEALLDDVCINVWKAFVPPPGTVPKSEQPDVITSLVTPAVLVFGVDLVVPVFTDERRARAFKGFASYENLDLVDIYANLLVRDVPAFSFVLPGLKQQVLGANMTKDACLIVAIDPTHPGTLSQSPIRIRLDELVETSETEPVSLLQAALGVDMLFIWRKKPE